MAGEIRLPDIGDFKDVPIIEIHVKPGQSVAKEEVLLTLESDKATLDVPAPEAGVIGEIKVKVGDKVSQGALLATLGSGGRRARPPPTPPSPPRPPATPAPAPRLPPRRRTADFECDIARARRRARAAIPPRSAPPISAQKVVLVDRRPTLGGVCLNVGCIPSKALLHVAKVIDEAAAWPTHGVAFGAPTHRPRRAARLEGRRRQAADRRPDRRSRASAR